MQSLQSGLITINGTVSNVVTVLSGFDATLVGNLRTLSGQFATFVSGFTANVTTAVAATGLYASSGEFYALSGRFAGFTAGFTGNVALKTLEGGLKVLFSALLEAFGSDPSYKPHADALLPALLPLHAQMSPDTYGGAVLLGVDGICIISHGSSGQTAIVNACKLAAELVRSDLVGAITAAFTA